MPRLSRILVIASCACAASLGCTVYSTTSITTTEEISSFNVFALIDDTVWSAPAAPYGSALLEGILAINATRVVAGQTVGTFTLYIPTGYSGVIPAGVLSNPGSAAAALYDNSTSTPKTWVTREGSNGSTVTITSASTVQVKGTFNFVLYAPASQTSGPQTRRVSGQFNAYVR
jgi:hypothetical protein